MSPVGWPCRAACLMWLVAHLLLPATGNAQFPDEIARQKIDELRQNDMLLRSSISGQRVDRQAEVSRLEGRIQQLEQQMRARPSSSGPAEFAYLLMLLDSDKARTTAAPTATSDEPAEAATEKTPETAVDAAPPPQTSLSHDATRRQLIATDYRLALDIEILDARASLLEKSHEVQSLERLSAKGLASTAQLELLVIQKQRAALQLQRLEQQRQALSQLFPQLFPTLPPPPTAN